MSRLGAVIKRSIEKKRYTISYGCWLQDTETLADFAIAVSPATDPLLIADGAYVTGDFKSVVTYLSQGKSGTIYTVSLIAQTSLGQQKLDELQMRVV
jgi:hypothetical protein